MRLDLDQLHHQRKEHEDTIANVPTSVPNRAKSAPAYAAAKNLSVQPRNIQSSPAAFTMNYVIERFHGQSLALAHSQEELEELHSNDGRCVSISLRIALIQWSLSQETRPTRDLPCPEISHDDTQHSSTRGRHSNTDSIDRSETTASRTSHA